MSKQLLPCAFCGGKPILRNAGPGNWWVSCESCKAGTDDGSKERAAGLWNARSSIEISDEDMRDLLSSKDVGSGRAKLRRLLRLKSTACQGEKWGYQLDNLISLAGSNELLNYQEKDGTPSVVRKMTIDRLEALRTKLLKALSTSSSEVEP
jgi:hypothetical protein